MTIIGPDVSFYQDKPDTPKGIDFAMMKAAGARFAIIRAGQNLWEDRAFDESWRNSKGVLPRGSYWFYDSRVDPKFQAKKRFALVCAWEFIRDITTGERTRLQARRGSQLHH